MLPASMRSHEASLPAAELLFETASESDDQRHFDQLLLGDLPSDVLVMSWKNNGTVLGMNR